MPQRELIQIQASERQQQMLTDSKFRVSIQNEGGADEAELCFFSVIGDDPFDEHAVGAAAAVEFLNSNRGRPVHMRFNTPGGLAWDGITIHNAALQHDAPVRGTIEGDCSSAGTIIAAGCSHLRMFENARYMIHRAWGMAVGNTDDMMEYAEILDRTDGQIARTLAARAGKPTNRIANLMKGKVDGTYFTAAEAKAEGFIDEIVKITRSTKNAVTHPETSLQANRDRMYAANRAAILQRERDFRLSQIRTS